MFFLEQLWLGLLNDQPETLLFDRGSPSDTFPKLVTKANLSISSLIT